MRNVMKLYILAISMSSIAIFAVTPTFHLKNNSDESIQIDISQSGKKILPKLATIAAGSDFKFNVDISKPITLEMYICDGKCSYQQPDHMIVTFEELNNAPSVTGKTYYLKWDGNTIDVQKGNKLGLTTKGYSMANNVDPLAIHTVRRPGKALKTGTAETIKEEITKNKPTSATTKSKTSKTKPSASKQPSVSMGKKPTKQSKTEEPTQSFLALPAPEPVKSDQAIEAEALTELGITKSDVLKDPFNTYLRMLGLKDEGSFADMKKNVQTEYKLFFDSWNPDAKGLSLNEQLLARKIRTILNEAERFLQADLTKQEKAFKKARGEE